MLFVLEGIAKCISDKLLSFNSLLSVQVAKDLESAVGLAGSCVESNDVKSSVVFFISWLF